VPRRNPILEFYARLDHHQAQWDALSGEERLQAFRQQDIRQPWKRVTLFLGRILLWLQPLFAGPLRRRQRRQRDALHRFFMETAGTWERAPQAAVSELRRVLTLVEDRPFSVEVPPYGPLPAATQLYLRDLLPQCERWLEEIGSAPTLH
jgi:hypothetical protein